MRRRFRAPFASLSEYQQALDVVIEQARHTLYLFDYDLHEGGWNGPQRYEVLKRFVLGSPNNRLHIALHSVDHVRRNCPRLLNLQRQYSYAVLIHETNPEARSINDPMLIADGRITCTVFTTSKRAANWCCTIRIKRCAWHSALMKYGMLPRVAVTVTTLGL